MSDITERLDHLKKTIQEDDFLQGKGLSNEVNIRMFCYSPKDEMAVRSFAERLENEQLKCNVQIVVLYPGTFDGHCVKLFNQLKSNEYYRAFNMI